MNKSSVSLVILDGDILCRDVDDNLARMIAWCRIIDCRLNAFAIDLHGCRLQFLIIYSLMWSDTFHWPMISLFMMIWSSILALNIFVAHVAFNAWLLLFGVILVFSNIFFNIIFKELTTIDTYCNNHPSAKSMWERLQIKSSAESWGLIFRYLSKILTTFFWLIDIFVMAFYNWFNFSMFQSSCIRFGLRFLIYNLLEFTRLLLNIELMDF